MKIYNKFTALLMVAAIGMSALTFTACNDDNDEFGTEQYVGGVHLNVFGPSPVARGGELRFLGSGLDQITSVEIPGCDPITDINVISTNEIRVTVPQSAEPGLVVLNFAKGNITTKTKLTYTEPISIESFAPAKVKAGDQLTITGEYLNLINEVIFPDEVVVTADEFLSHSRKEIKVTVPLEAKTGKFIISDGAEIPNWIYSDTELEVVIPSVDQALDLTDAKGGDVIAIKGKDMDLVVAVLMPNHEEVDFEYTKDGDIVFTLPADVCDGAIMLITASGVNVAVANIGVVMPVVKSVSPSEGIRAGDIITIEGANMDQVKDVTFAGVNEPVTPIDVQPNMIKVRFPDMATSGQISLNLLSGKTYEDITLETAKPEVLGFNPNPVAAAGEFVISGKNLDLIKKVTFGGGIVVEVENANAAELTLTAPATAETGPLTLTIANGETVETEPLTIDAPQCAFVTETVSTELNGGELLVVKVQNGNVLTSVQVNGREVQYIISGETLYISLPQTASKGTVVTLVSSNGEISYTYDVTPATHIENVIWSGMFECSGWNGMQDLAYGGFDWSTVPVGAKLNIHLESTVAAGEWWCISLRHGDGWANLPSLPGQYDMPESPLQVELTQEVLDDLKANMGLVVTGTGFIMNKITVSWEISLETPVALDGMPIELLSWENHETGPGTAFIDAGIQIGQKLRIHCNITGEDPCLQIFDGHWNAWTWPEIGDTQQFNAGNSDMTCIELEVTEDVYFRATTYTDWGYCIIFQGQSLVITSITLE